MPLLARLIDLYSLVPLAAIISLLDAPGSGPIRWRRIVYGLIEPVLAPIRHWLQPMGGLDSSPMVLMIGLQLQKNLLV